MIFLVNRIKNKLQVDVYEHLQDVAQRVEWQDILDNTLTILDDAGAVYAWDDSKSQEQGTVYDYTFKFVRTDLELKELCLTTFLKLNRVYSFEIEVA